jgi:DNA-binding MarR family transcriptional regulator
VLKAARSAEQLPDLPDAQVEILCALPAGVVRAPGELAAELGLSRPTVSNLLRAMETSGLITRRASAENRRGVDVRASDLALGLFERFDRASERVLADVLSLLPTDDRAALVAALPALERLRDAAST